MHMDTQSSNSTPTATKNTGSLHRTIHSVISLGGQTVNWFKKQRQRRWENVKVAAPPLVFETG
jgi:hypothetical protein